MAFQKGNVNNPPTKNRAKPAYLKTTATRIPIHIWTEYILSALKFKEMASKIPLFIKNISGATKMVTETHNTARNTVGIPIL